MASITLAKSGNYQNDNVQVRSSVEQLRIAYAIQNVGGIDFSQDVGDTVPVKYTLKGLRQAGHEVSCLQLKGRSIIGIDDISEPNNIWKASPKLAGTKLFRFFERVIRRLQGGVGLPYFALFDTYRFYEVCLRYLPHYTLCHEHNGLFCAGAALACSRLGMPYVLTFSADPLFELDLMGKPLRGIHARIAAWEASLTYRVAKKIICVSGPAKQHLVEKWQVNPEKIVVMPNGVDIELFGAAHDPEPARLELGLGQAPIIGFVGGFQVWHGLDGLVESFAQVLQQVPQAKLLLVGDGPARPLVEQKIAELDLESAVIITGFIPQSRVPEMLAVVDVAVIPYPQLPQELWFSPLKLYEYMAAGKTIVASNSGQIAEVIQDGHNGILVEAGNIAGFARAIIRLLNDPVERKRLGKNAQQQAVEQHSWEQYIKRLEEIYLNALEQIGA